MLSRQPEYSFRTAVLPFVCLLVLVLCLGVTSAQTATGRGDWWMYHHDAQHTGRSSFAGPASPSLQWTFTAGGTVTSTPVMGADGTIYATSNDDYLYALNPADGSTKWQYYLGSMSFLNGSPAVGLDGTIYETNRGVGLDAFNPADGSLKWQYTFGGEECSSPTIGTDGTIYETSDDYKLYAFNPSDGSLKWSYTAGGAIEASAALGADGTIYFGADDANFYAVNPADGSLKWTYSTGGEIQTPPTIGADGTIYFGSNDDSVYALNPANGSLKWKFITGGAVHDSPALGADGTIYAVSDDDTLYALNPANGSLKWKFTKGTITFSVPIVDANGTIYVGASDNNVYAINPADGSLKWQYTTGGAVEPSPSIGPDGTLYVGSDDYNLYAIGSLSATLTLTKSVSPASAVPGGLVTYTLAYGNTGSTATNVVLSDTLPAYVTYVANSASAGGSYNAGTNTLTWSPGTLTADGTGQVTFQAAVASTATVGATISNTADISCTEAPTPAPSNVAPFTVTAAPAAQLAFLTQPSTTAVGAMITPAVTVQVLDANGNLVTSATNAITLALAANPGGGTLGGTVTVNAVNGVATFNTLTVNSAGTGYTLSASSAGLTGATSSAFAITALLPALTLTKSVSQLSVATDGTVTYTLAYHNTGGAATNVVITDTLPAQVAYVTNSASGNAAYNATTNTLTWSLGALAAGGAGQVSFQATVTPAASAGSAISNTADITYTGMPTPVLSNTAAFTVVAVALQLTPSSPAMQGQPVTLTAIDIGSRVPEYKFYAFYPDATGNQQLVLIQDYAAGNTCSWTPAVAANYSVVVFVREQGETIPYDAYYIVSNYLVNAQPLSGVTLSITPASPQRTNTPITLTATAAGGTNVQFQFWCYNPAATPAWSQLQAYSTQATCGWTPSTAGNYLFSVTAKDGVTGVEVNTTLWYTITSAASLTAVSVAASPVSPQAPHTPITFTATPTGGTNVQYQFWLYSPAATPAWTQLQAYSTQATCAWQPTTAGNYLLSVTAQDGVGGTAVNTTAWYTITVVTPLTAVTVTPSPASPLPANTPITLSATATGGTNVQFQFWLYNPAATPAWTQLQAYSTQATCAWQPATAGSYLLSVTAQDGASATEVNTTAWYTITAPLSAVTVTLSPASPQPANTAITLSATATGGANVQYQFWIYDPAATPAWTQLQAYSALSTCAWSPTTAGDYLLSVTAQDVAGGTEVNTTLWYTVQ